MTAPTLGLPVQDKFQSHVHEKVGLAFGVVTQLWVITHSLASRLLKQRIRSGSQGIARMPYSSGYSKPSSA
jgi:hypothetical protein